MSRWSSRGKRVVGFSENHLKLHVKVTYSSRTSKLLYPQHMYIYNIYPKNIVLPIKLIKVKHSSEYSNFDVTLPWNNGLFYIINKLHRIRWWLMKDALDSFLDEFNYWLWIITLVKFITKLLSYLQVLYQRVYSRLNVD